MTNNKLQDYIIDSQVEVDSHKYTGSVMRSFKGEPDVTDGAKLLAYEVMSGQYGNAPYRKDNIYSAVMTYVNYLSKKL